MNDVDAKDFVDRYVSMWHEPEPTERRRRVEDLFAPDSDHYTASLEAHGLDQITARVAGAYERFVAGGEYQFRSCDDISAHHDSLAFHWEMVGRADGNVAGG